jgi:hypothetical protein
MQGSSSPNHFHKEYEMSTTYRTVEQVIDFLDGIPYINNGGCGVAALAIIRWLKTNKKKTVKPVYLDDDEFPPVDRAPNHVAVRLGKDYVDATGRNNFANPGIWLYSREVTESDLVTALNSPTWNSTFDRNNWLPIIESELNVDLSDVDTW